MNLFTELGPDPVFYMFYSNPVEQYDLLFLQEFLIEYSFLGRSVGFWRRPV